MNNKPNKEILLREENTVYIGTISYSKDSTSMNDLLCKNGYPIDEIIFTDTFKEFDLMYQYGLKVQEYFKNRYDKEITIIKPLATFEEWCFGVVKDKTAEGYGAIRGIPLPSDNESMCFHRRETKVKPLDKYLKEKYEQQGFRVMNRYFFTNKRTCEDMEKTFQDTYDRQITAFDFSDEPLKDCFCKI